jgi:hypothetical protein
LPNKNTQVIKLRMKYIFLVLFSFASQASWRFLPKDRIEQAKNLPAQSDTGSDKSWSCGVNSLARALVLLGKPVSREKFDDLLAAAPKSLGTPSTTSGFNTAMAMLAGGAAAGYQGHPFLGALLGLFGAAPFAIGAVNEVAHYGKSGPIPKWLADYARSLPDGVQAANLGFEDSLEMIKAIRENIDVGNPVIPLLAYSVMVLHYFVIIGYHADNKLFSVLDTDGKIYEYSEADVERIMDVHKPTDPFLPAVTYLMNQTTRVFSLGQQQMQRYNLIVFSN